MDWPVIRSAEDIMRLTGEIGFLPFFAGEIPGFSVEECCAGELWFSGTEDGPWEWKGPIARSGRCVYGKFFRGKAGFVSRQWLPDFCNFRRDGYDFDARFEDGLAAYKDKGVYDAVAQRGAVLSRELKEICGSRGFDTVITRLQMQTYLVTSDFVYRLNRYGRPSGWAVAQYAAPESLFGYDFVTGAYRRDPAQSREDILDHLKAVLPDATPRQLEKLLG